MELANAISQPQSDALVALCHAQRLWRRSRIASANEAVSYAPLKADSDHGQEQETSRCHADPRTRETA